MVDGERPDALDPCFRLNANVRQTPLALSDRTNTGSEMVRGEHFCFRQRTGRVPSSSRGYRASSNSGVALAPRAAPAFRVLRGSRRRGREAR